MISKILILVFVLQLLFTTEKLYIDPTWVGYLFINHNPEMIMFLSVSVTRYT